MVDIEKVITLYPANTRTCDNIGLAPLKGRNGCILFEESFDEVDGRIIASAINAELGVDLAASQGTCKATGAKVTVGASCGINDKRFRMGLESLLSGDK